MQSMRVTLRDKCSNLYPGLMALYPLMAPFYHVVVSGEYNLFRLLPMPLISEYRPLASSVTLPGIAICVDDGGFVVLLNLLKGGIQCGLMRLSQGKDRSILSTGLHLPSSKHRCLYLSWCPVVHSINGKTVHVVALAVGPLIRIYSINMDRSDGNLVNVASPFNLLITMGGHSLPIDLLSWSPTGARLASADTSGVICVHRVDFDDPLGSVKRPIVTGHSSRLLEVGWYGDSQRLVSVCKDGIVMRSCKHAGIGCKGAVGRESASSTALSAIGKVFGGIWSFLHRFYVSGIKNLKATGKVSCARLVPNSNCSTSDCGMPSIVSQLVYIGLETGLLLLIKLDESFNSNLQNLDPHAMRLKAACTVTLLQAFAVASQPILSMDVSFASKLVAFTIPKIGGLVVYDWAAKAYVLKQNSDVGGTSCIAASADGTILACGGCTGSVQLWNAALGICFVAWPGIFNDAVTSLCFGQAKQILAASSADGTVRLLDLVQLKAFQDSVWSPRRL